MDRRRFIKTGLTGVTLLAGSGLLLTACERDLRGEMMGKGPLPGKATLNMLDPDGYKILYYASLAPSGHNSQPWSVKIINRHEWIIGSDPSRWLSAVDGNNREVLLSIGAFVENLVQAAGALGYAVDTTVVAKDRFDEDVVRVRIEKSGMKDNVLARIVSRRTVKSNLLNKELKATDVNDFSKLTQNHLYYFPRGTEHSDLMAKEAVDNFVIQFGNKAAMQEAADWTRLKDADAKKYRDGLTPDGMEITGIAGFYVRHFMKTSDVTGQTFIEKGIEKIKQQAVQGAGWLVITSDGNTVADLLESGRRFQKMALFAREKGIALHPMTQALEEKHGQKNIRENHHSTMIPQFMLRVGYLEKYPDPVTLRRPVEWFVKG